MFYVNAEIIGIKKWNFLYEVSKQSALDSLQCFYFIFFSWYNLANSVWNCDFIFFILFCGVLFGQPKSTVFSVEEILEEIFYPIGTPPFPASRILLFPIGNTSSLPAACCSLNFF